MKRKHSFLFVASRPWSALPVLAAALLWFYLFSTARADGPVGLNRYAAWASTDNDNTHSVAWGDVDGDGDLDLAVGNGWSDDPNFASVRLYRNDSGMLTASAVWSSTESAYNDPTYSVAWGDVDGDGDLDLAADAKIYLNEGGTLQTTAAWTPIDGGSWSAAWGDMDGDGDLDLAAGTSVYLNEGGTLQTTAAWTPIDGSSGPVAWGDVDGDGDLDLAAEGSAFINVYLNEGGALQTTAAWTSSDYDYTTTSVAWGDVDGDGDLDLAAGGYDSRTKVYLNEGGILQTIPAWTSTDNDCTYSVAWGDMDGDGDLDLATGNLYGPNKVYLNMGATLQTSAAWTGNDEETTSVAWGDMDGDGDLDLAAGVWMFGPYVYLNVGGILQTGAAWWPSDDWGGHTTDVAWGDLDGDGDLDLAVGYDASIRVYLNEGRTLQTSAAWTSSDGDDTRSVAWGDVDGDGDLDLAAGNYDSIKVYLNEGGTLQTSAAWTSADADDTQSVAWGDVDGDGDLDLAAGNYDSIKVYLNEGGTLQTTAAWTSIDGGSGSVAWGDMDGDGDLDLAAGRSSSGKVYLNMRGTLQITPTWTTAENAGSIAWGDVDGDGDLDLAAGRYGGLNKVYLNEGEALQTTPAWTSADLPPGIFGSPSMAWGDVDGDGDLDLATQRQMYLNGRDGRGLPGSIPIVRIAQPGPNAALYSSPRIWSGTIPITYTLSDPQGDPVKAIRAWYSPDGGGRWYTPTAASGVITTHLGTTSFVTRTARNTIPTSILDLSTATSTLTLTPTDMIADLDVTLNLIHTADSNLVITLTAPFSRAVRLVNQRGGSGDNFANTVFDDEAATSIISGTAPFSGRFRPEQTLAHFDGYAPQGDWTLAIADVAGGDSGRLLSWGITATLNGGKVYTYAWDVNSNGFFGQSDNVVFRIQAVPAVVTGTRNATPGPYLYSAYASSTFPFRVRGTQVRVLSGTLPISNALVYRLPSGYGEGGAPYASLADEPFRTNGSGYLQGRGDIRPGDRLLALLPVPSPITWTNACTLYYTNGTPTPLGLDAFNVAVSGVQTITVSAAHPLFLCDLHVALEWDAHNNPAYLSQLETDLKGASRYLYDFTNGQVALGHNTIHQNGDEWVTSDVVIYATNRLRPLAIQGGVVLTPTVDPDHNAIVYDTGQVRMGATWNKYGDPGDDSTHDDWQRALAHELAHYLLFEEDAYLGLNGQGLLVPTGACTGSAMGDFYTEANTEFLDDATWLPRCQDTLAQRTLGRSEWATLRRWYPALQATANSGPSVMPFDFTTVKALDPVTPTATMGDVTFYLDYAGGQSSSGGARAFLLRQDAGGEYVTDLGSPETGQNRVLARGVRAGDRLCVFDAPRQQSGCETVAFGDDHLALQQDAAWTPLVKITPIDTDTLKVEVEGLTGGLTLQARLYPEYGYGGTPIALTYSSGVYSGLFDHLPYPAVVGYVRVSSTSPAREAMAGYIVGGNPGDNPFSRGHGPFSRGHGPFSRGHGPFSRGHGPFYRGSGAFVVSPDGEMSLFTPNQDFAEGDMYAIQAMPGLPSLPPGKTAIGPGYRLVSAGTAITHATISFQYLGIDALRERVDESGLKIHFWDGLRWRALDTVVDPYYNAASAWSQGDGVYALLAGTTIPAVGAVIPASATNDLTTTLVIGGGYFLAPVEVALAGPAGTYSLPVTAVSPVSLTVTVTRGLPAGEYQVRVANRLDAAAPAPGIFALYAPGASGACFYDFFESGAGKWERDGQWDIAILPGGERAMTDSPAGNYNSAIPPALTYTTHITSAAFNLSACGVATLTFRHDYVLAKVGSSQDSAVVEISTNGGATWTELARYTGGGIYGEGLETQDVEAPEWASVSWQDVEIGLSGYSGVARLRFSLEVDQNASDKGWILDDVMVKGEGGGKVPGGVFLPIILKE
jgi:subtilisin-like proprotein convertase family protein